MTNYPFPFSFKDKISCKSLLYKADSFKGIVMAVTEAESH